MKRNVYLLLSICAIALLTACQKTETFDDSWKLSNEQQFAKIAADPTYKQITSKSGKGFIMYKELKKGTGEKTPYFTDQVKVLYTEWYKNDWNQKDKYTDQDGNIITNKIIFDSTDRKNNKPVILSVIPNIASNGISDGFSTALQHMKSGDKWEVWAPMQLAYGTNGQNGIRGYTTLVYEIELVEILK